MYKYVGGKSKKILSLWYTMNDWDNTGFLCHESI